MPCDLDNTFSSSFATRFRNKSNCNWPQISLNQGYFPQNHRLTPHRFNKPPIICYTTSRTSPPPPAGLPNSPSLLPEQSSSSYTISTGAPSGAEVALSLRLSAPPQFTTAGKVSFQEPAGRRRGGCRGQHQI